MGLLTKALPRDKQITKQEPTVKSDYGMYNGFFIGITEPFRWVSEFGDKCRVCKGEKTGRNGEGVCFLCEGTGVRTEDHVKLRYRLENSITEEEEVSFKVSPSGIGRDGTPLSPSTLFHRLRTFSGMEQPTPDDLDKWYTELKKAGPIRIPVQVVIADNKTGTLLKITNVLVPRKASAASEPAPHAPASAPEEDDLGDIPF